MHVSYDTEISAKEINFLSALSSSEVGEIR